MKLFTGENWDAPLDAVFSNMIYNGRGTIDSQFGSFHRNDNFISSLFKGNQFSRSEKSMANDFDMATSDPQAKEILAYLDNRSRVSMLLDSDLIVSIFLHSSQEANQVSKIVDYLQSGKINYYMTSLSIERLRFHLGIKNLQLAESAILWLEDTLNVQVVEVEKCDVLSLLEHPSCNLDYDIELIVAKRKQLDSILSWFPEKYTLSPVDCLVWNPYALEQSTGETNSFKDKLVIKNTPDKSVSPLRHQTEQQHLSRFTNLLIDRDLVTKLFLDSENKYDWIEKYFSFLKSENVKFYITSLAIARLQFYLGIENSQVAENAVIWLEENLNIQVIDINREDILKLLDYSSFDFDYDVELIASKRLELDGILSLFPERYTHLIERETVSVFQCLDGLSERQNEANNLLSDITSLIEDDICVQLRASKKDLDSYRRIISKYLKEFNIDRQVKAEKVLVECLRKIDENLRSGGGFPVPISWFQEIVLHFIQDLYWQNHGFQADDFTSITHLAQKARFLELQAKLLIRQSYDQNVYIGLTKLDTGTVAPWQPGGNIYSSMSHFNHSFDFDLKLLGKDFQGADLTGMDLSRFDLSDSNFNGAILRKANLCGANLRNSKFDNADLSFANLRRANLDDSSLDNARLESVELGGASLIKASLKGANLTKATLKGSNFMYADLSGAILVSARFRGAKLQFANLSYANLNRADLIRANLKGANLEHATLRGACLNNAVMKRANLNGVDLRGDADNENIVTQIICVKLTSATIRNADLSGVLARRTNFNEADLSGSNLSSAKLLNTNFESCMMDGVNLSYSDLGGAILTSATLTNSDLSSIILRGASLKGANLKNSNLEGAKLEGAYLHSVNLQDANLSNCEAHRSNFDGANLQNVNLERAELHGAFLYKANLQGANFSNCKAHRANFDSSLMMGCSLESAELLNSSFCKANLSKANLQEVKLEGAILTEAILTDANLSFALLQGVSAKKANFFHANLEQTKMQGAYLKEADFQKANLHRADLSRARLKRANLSNANLSFAILRGSDFRYAMMQNVDLSEAQLEYSNLIGAYLAKSRLIRVDLSWANLSCTFLQGVDLSESNLIDVDLSAADMCDSILINSDLLRARLLATNLVGADLTNANCRASYFVDTNLTNTTLTSTNFQQANLSGAIFSNTDLSSCNLWDAKLLGADLSQVKTANVNLKELYFSSASIEQYDRHHLMFKYAANIGHRVSKQDLSDRLFDAKDMHRDVDIAIGHLKHIYEGFEDKAPGSLESVKHLNNYIEYLNKDYICSDYFFTQLRENCSRIDHLDIEKVYCFLKALHEFVVILGKLKRDIYFLCLNPNATIPDSVIGKLDEMMQSLQKDIVDIAGGNLSGVEKS
jgi:uncharacterized protein YjbI with pentapeptide repeats